MEGGKLDRWITLQRNTPTQDTGSGENVDSWATLATLRAAKRDVSDTERVASAEVQAEITTRFQIRWSSAWSSLNAKDRLTCEGKTYQIVGTKEIGRHEGIEISASARAD